MKLVDHSTSPDPSAFEFTVESKNVVGIDRELRLTGIAVTSGQQGNESGYIVVKNNFVIAKGRVGVI